MAPAKQRSHRVSACIAATDLEACGIAPFRDPDSAPPVFILNLAAGQRYGVSAARERLNGGYRRGRVVQGGVAIRREQRELRSRVRRRDRKDWNPRLLRELHAAHGTYRIEPRVLLPDVRLVGR